MKFIHDLGSKGQMCHHYEHQIVWRAQKAKESEIADLSPHVAHYELQSKSVKSTTLDPKPFPPFSLTCPLI